MEKSEMLVDVQIGIPAWQGEIASYLAEKQGLTLEELSASFLRQWACDAQQGKSPDQEVVSKEEK